MKDHTNLILIQTLNFNILFQSFNFRKKSNKKRNKKKKKEKETIKRKKEEEKKKKQLKKKEKEEEEDDQSINKQIKIIEIVKEHQPELLGKKIYSICSFLDRWQDDC